MKKFLKIWCQLHSCAWILSNDEFEVEKVSSKIKKFFKIWCQLHSCAWILSNDEFEVEKVWKNVLSPRL
jgi:hypothetical protein